MHQQHRRRTEIAHATSGREARRVETRANSACVVRSRFRDICELSRFATNYSVHGNLYLELLPRVLLYHATPNKFRGTSLYFDSLRDHRSRCKCIFNLARINMYEYVKKYTSVYIEIYERDKCTTLRKLLSQTSPSISSLLVLSVKLSRDV